MFIKDTRNKRANGNAKGRNNAKEIREKQNKIERRKGNPSDDDSEPESIWEEPKSKYANGKAPRVQKEQEYYNADLEEEGGRNRRKKEKGMMMRR